MLYRNASIELIHIKTYEVSGIHTSIIISPLVQKWEEVLYLCRPENAIEKPHNMCRNVHQLVHITI